jgi:hypothetical protein
MSATKIDTTQNDRDRSQLIDVWRGRTMIIGE